MRDGAFATPPSLWDPSRPLQAAPQASTLRAGSNLHALALSWLREDRELRLAEEKSGKRVARGPKASDVSLELGVGICGNINVGVLTVLPRLSRIRKRSTRNMITRTRRPSSFNLRSCSTTLAWVLPPQFNTSRIVLVYSRHL